MRVFWFFAICAVLIAGWLAVVWLMPEAIEPIKDEEGHARTVMHAINQNLDIRDTARSNPDYPPAFYLLSATFGKILHGTSRAVLSLPNLLLALLVCFLIWRMSVWLYEGQNAWLPVLFTATFLFVFSCRMVMEMTVVGSVVLFVFACVFLVRKDSISGYVLLALATAFAALSKQTTPFFMAVPFCWLAWKKARSPRPFLFFVKLGLSLAAGLLVAYYLFYSWNTLDWWLANLLRRSGHTGGLEVGAGHGLIHLFYYPIVLGAFLLVPISIFFASVVFRKKKAGPETWWLLATVGFPMVAFTFFSNKFYEFILPVIPLLALAVLGPLGGFFESRKGKMAAIAATLALGFVPLAYNQIAGAHDHVAYFRALAAQEDLFLAEWLENYGDEREMYFVSEWSGKKWTLEKALRRKGINSIEPKRVNRYVKLPETLVVFRFGDDTDFARCLSKKELDLWKGDSPEDMEMLRNNIARYDAIRTFRVEPRNNWSVNVSKTMAVPNPITICRRDNP